jgi:geranylgeranyl diphosphate synthase type II
VTPERALAARRRLVERALRRYVPARRDTLSRAMRYTLLSGGKRLRPLLVLAAGEAVGGRQDELLPFACGIEMIHVYSLVHDDLPAMDDDEFRRGKPTVHRVFGEAVAILAGDALLTEAFRVMAEPVGRAPSGATLEAIRTIAVAAGMTGMVAGQVADLAHEGAPATLASVRLIHRRKTAALIGAAARAGGILGGARRATLARLVDYGEALGLGLQIGDDLRDVEAPSAVTGKVAGRDRTLGKATYAAVLGCDGARAALRGEIARALEAIASLGSRGALLAHLARQVEAWGSIGAA